MISSNNDLQPTVNLRQKLFPNFELYIARPKAAKSNHLSKLHGSVYAGQGVCFCALV